MKRPLLTALLLVCLLVFVMGLFQIFQLRFEAGDVYPEYSSLRSDPLGTMALYESLNRMPGLSASRDYSANNQLPAGRDTTYLHNAAATYEWTWMPSDTIKEIEGFLTSGGRLAVSFFPETATPFRWFDEQEHEPISNKRSDAKGEKSKKEPAKRKLSKKGKDLLRRSSLKERWGLQLAFLSVAKAGRTNASDAINETDLPLPQSLEWHGGIIFTNLPASWHVIYSRLEHPVVIERKFGAGALVMATDSYFLSNEALLKNRHADFLSWWIGPNKHITFDEAHLGVVESPGVAGLIRKYHLHGLVLGLVLLAGLFIWKNSVSFVPPYAEDARADFVPGKDSAAGFVNLLRRNIPSAEIVELCFVEWKRSVAQGNKHLEEKQARALSLLEAEKGRPRLQRDALRLYCEIAALLKVSARGKSK